MNDALQKQLAEMLQKLMALASDGATFAANQIPPLVQEKIALGRVEESLCFGVGVIALIAAPFLIKAAISRWEAAEKAPYGQDGPALVRAILTTICAIGSVAVGGTNGFGGFHNFVLVWFAPRLYIVEWLRTLVTK